MRRRLYFDEDSSDTDLLRALRLRGVEVVAAAGSGMQGQPDEAQLRWATQHQHVLYSSNRGDFLRIHSDLMRSGRSHYGIVLGVQQRYSVGEQMRRLLRLADKLSADEMINRIEFLSAWG